jgi:hypothetical protein
MRNQPEQPSQCEKCHKLDCQRNQEHASQICETDIQVSIDKLRDRKQIIHVLVDKSNIIQGKVVIYLDDADTKHLTFLVIPKSHILLV